MPSGADSVVPAACQSVSLGPGGELVGTVRAGEVHWVRNARAADGRVILRHSRRATVRLEEVSADTRRAILRRHVVLAPGARPHIPVDRNAPLEELERIAPQAAVFHIASVPIALEPAG